MQAKPEYRDREDTEVAVLDALADRGEDGMTIFELRSHADLDIDELERALAQLKADGLISADEDDDDRTVIIPDEAVVGPDQPEDDSLFDWLRNKLPF